jgi:hypothetical protein
VSAYRPRQHITGRRYDGYTPSHLKSHNPVVDPQPHRSEATEPIINLKVCLLEPRPASATSAMAATPRLVESSFPKLLVYEPGGFFLPHRDSEKHDRMVASMIVVLPNPFEGGVLIVRQTRGCWTRFRHDAIVRCPTANRAARYGPSLQPGIKGNRPLAQVVGQLLGSFQQFQQSLLNG